MATKWAEISTWALVKLAFTLVKLNTTWFIGRSAFRERERNRTGVVVRFRFNEKNVRMAHHGDLVVDDKGKVIGKVTSCAIDQNGGSPARLSWI